jgi:hypothetical protein
MSGMVPVAAIMDFKSLSKHRLGIGPRFILFFLIKIKLSVAPFSFFLVPLLTLHNATCYQLIVVKRDTYITLDSSELL